MRFIEVIDVPFPECRIDKVDLVTSPLLVANYTEFDEIVYCDGKSESVVAGKSDVPEETTRENLNQITKHYNFNDVVDILVRHDMCKVIKNKISLENEVHMTFFRTLRGTNLNLNLRVNYFAYV